MMMTEDVSVSVRLECTGNPLADFHVGSLADVAVTGDHVGFYNQEDTGVQLAEVIGRDIYYMEAGCGLRRVLSVCLTVKCPFENWLYLWQDIVEACRDGDVQKAYRKSDRFLRKHADWSSVEFLLRHHDAYLIDRFGVSLLNHFVGGDKLRECEYVNE